MNIKVAIPAAGRPELTRRVALYYEGLGIPTVIAVDDTDEHPREFWDFMCMGSYRLGRKFNDTLWWAGHESKRGPEDPDGILLVGSDNLIAPYYIERIVKDKPFYREIHGCHFFNSATGEMAYQHRYYCGAGKYFSREFLEGCNYNPYDPKLDVDVDASPKEWLYKLGGKRETDGSDELMPLCIDIKTAENMTTWERVAIREHAYMCVNEDIPGIFDHMNGETPERWMGL